MPDYVTVDSAQAIEREDKLREGIYDALAQIPRKLELIHSLTDCHRSSIEIYQAGDAVLLALFDTLERIINEMTKSKGSKPILPRISASWIRGR